MKKYFLILSLTLVVCCCSKENNVNRNPYLTSFPFTLVLNLNLPSYSGLNSNINPKLILEPNAGINGLIVMKISDTEFKAWEANCPNQSQSACSRMTINGVNAKCSCDNKEYSLFTGVGNGEYPMLAYRVDILANNSIRISN